MSKRFTIFPEQLGDETTMNHLFVSNDAITYLQDQGWEIFAYTTQICNELRQLLADLRGKHPDRQFKVAGCTDEGGVIMGL